MLLSKLKFSALFLFFQLWNIQAWAQIAANAKVAPAMMPPDHSTGLLQMLLGLGCVLALILTAAWLLRRLGIPSMKQHPLLKPIGMLSVGTRERVVVIEIEDQWLVLGVAPGRITALHTLAKGNTSFATEPDSSSPTQFAQQIFTQKLKQILRHSEKAS